MLDFIITLGCFMAKSEYEEEKGRALGEYINNIREHRGLGHNQLAILSGIDGSVLHKILYGSVKKVNPFHLQALAKVLRIDYKILYQIVGYLDAPEGEIENSVDNDFSIPVFSKIFPEKSGEISFGQILEYLNSTVNNNNKDFIGVRIDDNSMEHTIPNKSTIIIHMNSEVLDEEIGVFILNDHLLIKRFIQKNGFKMLVSDNSAFYPIVITETDSFFTIGKVIEVMYKL